MCVKRTETNIRIGYRTKLASGWQESTALTRSAPSIKKKDRIHLVPVDCSVAV